MINNQHIFLQISLHGNLFMYIRTIYIIYISFKLIGLFKNYLTKTLIWSGQKGTYRRMNGQIDKQTDAQTKKRGINQHSIMPVKPVMQPACNQPATNKLIYPFTSYVWFFWTYFDDRWTQIYRNIYLTDKISEVTPNIMAANIS